jgi:hypothetical protein
MVKLSVCSDGSLAAALPAPPGLPEPFQRVQYGGRVGGPIIKGRFFYFIDGERTLQHEQAPVIVAAPFQQYSGSFGSPFHENNFLAKADYQLTRAIRTFYRFSYFQNSFAANGGLGFSVYHGRNIARTHVAGVDFGTGSCSHSIRFGYLKYENQIADGTIGSGLPLANYPLEILMGNTGLVTGPNNSAPSLGFQSNHQFKYDGTKTQGRHIIRYGFDFNRIASAAFAPGFSRTPAVLTNVGPSEQAFAAGGTFTCPVPNGTTATGASCPLNYPVELVAVGNGLGNLTATPAFGLPAGGRLYHRLAAYVGASSKFKKNFTLTYGARYIRETGRTDSNLPAIPQLNDLISGLGNPVRQPNLDFAPQLGFAWDPTGKGKTSVRGGIGLFYENVLTVVAPFDVENRLTTGDVFSQSPLACNGTATPLPVPIPGGTLHPTFCSATVGGTPTNKPVAIGAVASQIDAFQKQYQADYPFNLKAPNPNYIGLLLQQGLQIELGGASIYAPGFRTPRSVEINIGVQREIRPGTVVSADFVRNIQTHYLLNIDENHTGDVRYFDKSAALQAIAATNQSFNCGTGTDSNSIHCAINAGAQITHYANNGLTSSADLGVACSFQSVTGPGMYPCSFAGVNAKSPLLNFMEPIGRSVLLTVKMFAGREEFRQAYDSKCVSVTLFKRQAR